MKPLINCSFLQLAITIIYSCAPIVMPHSILIFGGNGFMGAETSRQLLAHGHNLTLVSRGSWDWNSGKTVKPYVRHLKCDRKDPEQAASLMKQLADSQFDIVIDFSAYKLKAVEPFYDFLASRVKLFYLYISTDSVYEVCELSNGPASEVDAVRPKNPADQEKLNKLDSYGHHKLRIEEFLIEKQEKGGLPYVILRLPDVLGPRDSTGRFWRYQLWLMIAEKLEFPVPIPYAVRLLRTSYVYSKDVAALITKIANDWTNLQSTAANQIFNIGFEESKSLKELLLGIRDVVDDHDGNDEPRRDTIVTEDDRTNGLFYFPSVTRGNLDVSKAVKILGWSPTPWSQALKEIVSFHISAMMDLYQAEFMEVVTDLYADIEEFINDRQRTELNKLIEGLQESAAKIKTVAESAGDLPEDRSRSEGSEQMKDQEDDGSAYVEDQDASGLPRDDRELKKPRSAQEEL